MSAAFATLVLVSFLVFATLWLTCAVLGLYGLILGRAPGRWLRRHVRQPRLWGAGVLLVAAGNFAQPSVTVVGVGLIALGHVVRPAP
ncbi:hypothetical protein ABTX34_14525 [Streptomyces sp. NPDC096538]|uniref:hypothetical protein n=1 Tax=Streptomyces sp. NPDC096538 TaxID=3155427 RepID=UPI0033190A89